MLGEESLLIFQILYCLSDFTKILIEMLAPEKRDGECHVSSYIVARQVCLVRLLVDGLISRIFHQTQPRGTFAQQVSVSLSSSQWPSNTPQDFPLKLSNNFWAYPCCFQILLAVPSSCQ
jgi:hypothetical protein